MLMSCLGKINMKSWEDYEKHFAVQSANEKGDLFEQFCKALIATHKSFMAKEVYLWHEIPTKEGMRKLM